MTICAAIWGIKNIPKNFEQLTYKAARYFLGVHRYAPIEALLGDMGWTSARNRHKILLLKFWNRLCIIPESRITRKVFEWDRRFVNTRGTWSHAVREVLKEVNHIDSFSQASQCNIPSALEIIKDISPPVFLVSIQFVCSA